MYRFLYRTHKVSGFKYACYKRFDLSKIKSSAIQPQLHRYECRIRRTQFQLRWLCCFFGRSEKKELSWNREIPRCCIGTLLVRPPSFEGFIRPRRGLASWIPDNGKNLVPRRTIGRRPFPERGSAFRLRRRRLPSRCISIPIYPSVSLPARHLIFSSVLSSFSSYFTTSPVSLPSFLWTRSVRRRIFFFAPQRNPSSPFHSHAKSLRSPVFYSEFRETSVQSGLSRFREFWRSWLSETTWREKRGK